MDTNKKTLSVILAFCQALIGVFIIGYLNYQIIGGWFGKNGPANIGSIEVSYVSMGKFLVENGLPFFGNNSWAPFWYLGFPMHLFYTPLLPFLEFILNSYFRIPLWESYRLITGVAYILAPISVMFLGWHLSKKFVGGFVAGTLYSVAPSIIYFVVPEVSYDIFSPLGGGFLDPRRFTILVRWGEGPHTLSLVFLPLAGVFFSRFLEGRKYRDLIFASIFLGLTALSNSLGLFAAILLAFAISFVYFSQNKFKVGKSAIFGFLGLGGVSLGLISFWYNLSFLTNFFGEGQGTLNKYLSLFPWGWLLALLGIGVIYYLIKKLIKDSGIAASLIWFVIVFTVVSVYYLSAPALHPELRLELLPQALRYNTEVDLALSVFIGTVMAGVIKFLGTKLKYSDIFLSLCVFGISLYSFLYINPFIKTAKVASSVETNLSGRAEEKIAEWLNGHMAKEERAVVPGNYGFYLNWFNYTNQLRGGLYQASSHPWSDHAYYQLANGDEAGLAKAWLTIINAKYLVVSTLGSADLYKDFKNTERFSSLDEVYNEAGDIIYETGLARPSLAKPVNLATLKSLRIPKKADDEKPIFAYTSWLDNSSKNETVITKVNNSTYKISGKVGSGEGIQVAMTYDPGWQVSGTLNGKKIGFKKIKDLMSFLVIVPEDQNSGEVALTLSHKPSIVIWLGYLTSLVTVGLLIFFGLKGGFLPLPKQ